MDSTARRAVVDHVRLLAELGRRNAPSSAEAAGWRYHCVAELLLTYGRWFGPWTAPGPGWAGPARRCFANASDYADGHSTAVYVEGVASRVLTAALGGLEHAWCSTGGEAIDPTWPDGEVYLGIPFTHRYRRHRQTTTGRWSLLCHHDAADLLRNGIPDHAIPPGLGTPQ